MRLNMPLLYIELFLTEVMFGKLDDRNAEPSNLKRNVNNLKRYSYQVLKSEQLYFSGISTLPVMDLTQDHLV